MKAYRIVTTGIALCACAVAGTGTAFAYWTATGSGTGAASVASARPAAQALTTSTGTTTTLLRPGLTGDVTVTITNPNGFAASVNAINLGTATSSTCTTPALTFPASPTYKVGGSTVTLPLAVPAGQSKTVLVQGGVAMGASSSDCQGKAMAIPLTLNWTG